MVLTKFVSPLLRMSPLTVTLWAITCGNVRVAGRLTSPDSSFQMLVFDAGKETKTKETPLRLILPPPIELANTVSLEREPEEYVPTPISHLVSFSMT